MSNDLFDIVFRGDIVMGHNIVEVKQRLAQLFKIDAAKVDALFTGRAVPLKRNIDAATAQKYQAIIAKAGAQTEICPAGGLKPTAIKGALQAQRTRNGAQPAAQPKTATEKKPLTLKERLEQQAKEQEAKEREAKIQQPAPPASAPPTGQPTAPPTSTAIAADGSFSIAPVGVDLVAREERQQVVPVAVDTSGISLRAQEGDLLDDSEKAPPVEAMIEVGDYDVAEAGSDLLQESERVVQPPVAVVDSDFDVADVGVDMLDAEYKSEQPAGLDIDTGVFDLAPVGSDLGQEKKEPPPPPPDTSALSLSD